ncbi:MAG: hypothetical protein ACKV19_00290 [Verrucomicrobiales bacterium]
MKYASLVPLCGLFIATSAHGASILADSVSITRTSQISNPGFHITEVQVFEQGTAVNVAAASVGATATASSTGWGTSPAWAIDGNTDGAFGANSTWHDLDGQAGDDPNQADVLTVSFGSAKTVDSFDVWGRSDCCADRDDGINVDFFLGGNLVVNQPSGITTGFNTGMTTIIPEPAVSALVAGAALIGFRRRRRA